MLGSTGDSLQPGARPFVVMAIAITMLRGASEKTYREIVIEIDKGFS
jgi:hypothetical protein